MLITLSTKSAEPRKSEVEVDGDNKAGRDVIDDIEVDSGITISPYVHVLLSFLVT